MNVPIIFVFTGTSGSGRKTIAHRIGKEFGLTHVVSCTTRQPREKEITDTRDYHYLTREQFDETARSGGFVQRADIDHESYGIRNTDLEEALQGGRGVYMILNKDGATAIKSLYGDRVVRLFLYVDKQTVRERLEAIGTRFDVIERYLDHYTEEVLYRKQCEHVFENVELKRTLEWIGATMRKHLQDL